MKKITAMVLAAIVAVATIPASVDAAPAPAPAQADEAAKLTEARSILAVMFPPSQREAMFIKLQADLGSQFSALLPATLMADPGLKGIFEEFKNAAFERQRAVLLRRFPAQLDAMATAYAREFSLGELKDIHAFARTSSGAHYFSKSLSMIGDPAVAKVNTETVAQIHAVTQDLLPGFKDKVVAYLKAHPDVAAKIEAQDAGK